MTIVISIPAFNEEKTIGPVIDAIKKSMGARKYHILVVNDGSKDKTVEVAKSHGAVVYSNKRNLGLAKTFAVEMELCRQLKADIIVHTDADGQYPARYIPRLIAEVEKGYDIVLGSRFKKFRPPLPFMKRIGNIAFAKVFSHITGKPLTDTTTGFRAFTSEVADNISLISSFTYTQEQLIRAAKQGYKIKEVSIKVNATRESRLFSSPMEYAVKAWINIFRIYRDFDPLKFFGMIGMSLFSLGILIGLWFVYLHFTVGITGHLGMVMLMIILLFTGIQIILFGFLADMGKRED